MQQRGLPSKKQVTLEIEILNDRYFQSRRAPLLSLVQRLQDARDANDIRALQLDLIAEIGALEQIAPELDAEHGGPALKRRDELKAIQPKTEDVIAELREVNEVLRRLEQMHFVVGAVRHATRVLADGMAWRLLDCDRTALALLADRQVVAKHAPPVGFKAEMNEMDRLERTLGTVVIHNDTTYCLRHGDVTAVVDVGGRRLPLPHEVKAGRSSAARQQQEINATLRQIEEDRLLVPVLLSTHVPMLESMIAQAKASGYAEQRIDCRFVQVIDYRHFGGREQEVGALIAAADRKLGRFGDGRLILAGIAGAARIRDRGDPIAELAPMSIFPLPAKDVIDLLMGAIDLRVHLNTELLALEFAKRGIKIEFAEGDQAAKHFLLAQRGYLGLLVPAYVREQMLYELLTTDALIGLVEWVLDSGLTVEWARKGKTPVIAFADERPAWVGGGARITLAA